MTNKAKWTTLCLSLLVLLPLAAYFYFSAPSEPPAPEPPSPIAAPEPPSPIAALIAEDRCDLAYPQLTALDTSQHHEPTAQAHIRIPAGVLRARAQTAKPRVRSFARPRPANLR